MIHGPLGFNLGGMSANLQMSSAGVPDLKGCGVQIKREYRGGALTTPRPAVSEGNAIRFGLRK